MPGWTKRNFDDLDDHSPTGLPMRWSLSRNAVHSSQVGVSRFTYEPGARMPFGHRVGGRRAKGGDTERFEDFWPVDAPAT